MSKRNKKKKFKNYDSSAPATVAAQVGSSAQAVASASSLSVSSSAVSSAPASTKKQVTSDADMAAYAAHKSEYDDIHKDLIKVAIVNGLLLAGILTMYFVNKQNGFLDAWFNQIF